MFQDRNYNRYRYHSGNEYYHAVPVLIMINVFVFLLQNVFISSYGNYSYSPVTVYFSLNAMAFRNFQVWRIVTYMFLHANFFHILVNMWGLYLFGSMLERRIGSTKFLILYFISGISGGLLWLVFNLSTLIPCVGASAALFGVMVSAAMMFPNVMIMLLIPPIPLKLKTFVIVYALIETFLAMGGAHGSVAHLAHLGGLIGGYFYMRNVFPRETFDVILLIRNFLSGHNSHQPPGSKYSKSRKASNKWKFSGKSSKNIDEILDKISHSGINSLTEEEMEVLRKARDKMKK
ncbi:MAG: rhomboid family intramembrane serine protease [Victivallales bacterium]|nr:rhomboid family intramembrane serine protease [Victivallales bacterium]